VLCILSGRGLYDRPIPRPEESYGYLFVVIAVFCQVEVSATGRSLVQRNPMDICVVIAAFCQVEVSAKDRSFVQRSPTKRMCVYAVRCNNNPLYL